MPGSDDGSSAGSFSATFPDRVAAALADARGAIAGIASSAEGRDGELIDPGTLARLHEIYRLKVELEIETAGVLWRTAEVVCALADALDVLRRRESPAPLPPRSWLPGLNGGSVLSRRSGASLEAGLRHAQSWFDSAASGRNGDHGAPVIAAVPQANGGDPHAPHFGQGAHTGGYEQTRAA
jgi:hypothetical protein